MRAVGGVIVSSAKICSRRSRQKKTGHRECSFLSFFFSSTNLEKDDDFGDTLFGQAPCGFGRHRFFGDAATFDDAMDLLTFLACDPPMPASTMRPNCSRSLPQA